MSAPQSDEETQLETQGDNSQYEEPQNAEDEEIEPLEPDEDAQDAQDAQDAHQPEGNHEQADSQDQGARSKKRKKEPTELEREPGKSLLPISRVQKIIKADKEIPIVAKEATFLISLATEEFIKRLTEAGYAVSQKEKQKRMTVQHKDLATVTRRADEFWFLEDIMPLSSKPKATGLDHFVGGNKKDDGDIVMNEDGTMYAAGNAEDDL